MISKDHTAPHKSVTCNLHLLKPTLH